jgi:hypothetical protein
MVESEMGRVRCMNYSTRGVDMAFNGFGSLECSDSSEVGGHGICSSCGSIVGCPSQGSQGNVDDLDVVIKADSGGSMRDSVSWRVAMEGCRGK